MEDLRGEMEMVNSKSSEEEDDDEKEWVGEEGSVYDLVVCLSLSVVVVFAMAGLVR